MESTNEKKHFEVLAADIDLTRKLKEAGKFREIAVLDHIILTGEAYFSFADERPLWSPSQKFIKEFGV